VKCCVCDRQWADDLCHTLHLTEDEKEYMAQSGQVVPDTYHYCPACWRILSDKNMGAQLIKGTIQTRLRSRGVPNADAFGQLLFKRLLELKKR